jgi:glycosyltransferase involved in cell wall biosynthesis
MRVIMLSWEYPPRIVGGISPHVHDLSEELVRQGVEVHVVTKETPGTADEEVEPSGVHVHRVHLGEKPNDFVHEIQLLNRATDIRVRRLLEDWRPGGEPTIFHAHDWLSLDAARALKYEYKLPFVATVHATESGRHGGIFNDTSRYIHEQEYWLTYEAWRIIVCSEFMKGEVSRLFNSPSDKIDVVYNGVKAANFKFQWSAADRAQFRSVYALPEEKIVIFVGRFVREKGIQVLLNAASSILAQEPSTKFLIVGGGNRDKFEKFSAWMGLQGKIIFTGFMGGRPLHQLYRIADVAAFPSLYEPFGIVALEAMAAGAPVVASDAGGLREVVLHDKTGTLSYVGDSASLAWAVLKVLQEPARAQALTEAAKLRLESDFSWPTIAARTIEIYDQVWTEFLASYWIEDTVWPVSPGAEERARSLQLGVKAETGALELTAPAVPIGLQLPIEPILDPDEEWLDSPIV